jgi:histidine ammonia-lyase
VEAMSGSDVPFDPRIHQARGQQGQMVVARNIRRILTGSRILAERPLKRVQEPYCLRCLPQVHGAGRDVCDFAAGILEREINGATDNPLVFAEDGDILSGGNFHGEPLALAMDALGSALTSLSGISERRTAALMDSNISGLPGFLSKKQGLHSGFMIAQVTAASLVSENRILAHPASVDSIPTSANQEDYVSMGMTAANKAVRILENTQAVLAIELLAACQGVELRAPLKPSPVLSGVIRAFRGRVPPLLRDRVLSEDISKAVSFIRSCEWKPALPASWKTTKDGRS